MRPFNPLHILLLATIVSCGAKDVIPVAGPDGTVSYGEQIVGQVVDFSWPGVETTDSLSVGEDGVILVKRTFTATENIDSVRLTLDFVHFGHADYVMIPAICYNGNQWGKGLEPKGFETDGVCHTYSFRRSGIPGASYSEGPRFAVALWTDAPSCDEGSFSFSVLPSEERTVHSLIYPEEEMPRVYRQKDSYAPGFARKMSMSKGDSFVAKAYVSVAPVEPSHAAVRHFLESAWVRADKDSGPEVRTQKDLWEFGVQYLTEVLWEDWGDYHGVAIGYVADDWGEWGIKGGTGWTLHHNGGQAAWVGQNLSVAISLLTDYAHNGREISRDKALSILDTWSSDKVVLPNGLYLPIYTYVVNPSDESPLDCCELGVVATNMFEAADTLRVMGLGNPDRLDSIAYGILDFVVGDQQPDGCLSKGWYPDGSPIDRDAGTGAFMIPPLIQASLRTGDAKYMDAARKAYKFYFDELKRTGYTTAGAQDTWCIDKESGIPLLKAALDMYDLTGKKGYIADAELAAYYLTTWMWYYKLVYPTDDQGIQYIHEYNTFGSTAVSTQHQCLDSYGCDAIGHLLRLADATGNEAWRERAFAIWNACRQMVSDGTLVVNGRLRPVGALNEAFWQCRWDLTFPCNDWLNAWPCALRLEMIRKHGSSLPD